MTHAQLTTSLRYSPRQRQVLSHLIRHKRISALEASMNYDMPYHTLGHVVHFLRREGYDIVNIHGRGEWRIVTPAKQPQRLFDV
jgi:hypothetical protein